MPGPLAKNGTANPNMRGAVSNGGFIIRAHAHAQVFNVVAAGNVSQQIKMRRGVFVSRRDTHQSGNAQTMLITARRDEPVSVGRQCAGLLRLLTRIDLQVQIRVTPLRLDLTGKHPRKLDPINRMNGIKKGDRVFGLVGLQGSDQVDLRIWKGSLQPRPFLLSFLHSVFTKEALSCFKDGNYGFGRKRLADRNKRNGLSRAISTLCRLINPGTDGMEGFMVTGVWEGAHGR